MVVHTEGMDAPPAGSEVIATAFPTLTGFTLTYKQVNGPFTMVQTSTGSQGNASAGVISSTLTHIIVPYTSPTLAADLAKIANDYNKFGSPYVFSDILFYESSTGNKRWDYYVLFLASTSNGAPNASVIISTHGIAVAGTGSERVAVAQPNFFSTWAGPGFVGGALPPPYYGWTKLGAPLKIFPSQFQQGK